MKRRSIQSSTLRSHKNSLDSLKERHTNEDSNRMFLEEFAPPEHAAPIHPVPTTTTPVSNYNGDNDDLNEMSDADATTLLRKRHTKKKVKEKQSHKRCRQCGKCYALPEWRPYHKNNISSKEDWGDRRPSARHLRNGPGNKVWDNCTVPSDEYDKGFPVDKGKALPRKRSRSL